MQHHDAKKIDEKSDGRTDSSVGKEEYEYGDANYFESQSSENDSFGSFNPNLRKNQRESKQNSSG